MTTSFSAMEAPTQDAPAVPDPRAAAAAVAARVARADDDTRRRWDRLAAAGLPLAEDADLAQVAWVACAQAPYLATLVARDPSRLVAAARDPYLRRPKPAPVMAAELDAALAAAAGAAGVDDAALIAGLRAWRAREFVRLGARECGFGERADVGRELACMADVAFDAAIRLHDAELAAQYGEPTFTADDGSTQRARLAVIAMGKHGGQELNFGSDVDVVYVYSSDAGAAGELSLNQYFEKLARRVTRAIEELTEDDFVFRVDLRLRPEGGRGPLVNSLASTEHYYETWGRPWDRLAWLKARACAGDRALGDALLAALEPFVWPRTMGTDVVESVRELNRRIKSELAGDAEPGRPRWDVKVGLGGIREVEFFVQALQLVHGGKARKLRERGTRPALERLLFAGLVAERERRVLGDAYELWRHVEHLLQLDSGRQTQRLPDDAAAVARLAWRAGYPDVAAFEAVVSRRAAAVSEIFETLGGGGETIRTEIAALLGRSPQAAEQPDRAPALAALATLGFRDPERCLALLDAMRKRPSSPLGAAASADGARLAPALLAELAASPDPDQALGFALDFSRRAGAWAGHWRLLEENRSLLRLVCSLFGTSIFLSRSFVEQPELLDTLLMAGRAGPRRTRSDLAQAISERLGEVAEDDVEEAGRVLRRVKTEEVLRIGLADIAGELDVDSVCARLSELADELVGRVFDGVRRAFERKVGRTLAPMAVLAMGKLGGRELGYAADVDLVCVYDGDVGDHEAMTKLAQRLVHALDAFTEEGLLYEVDLRLRPSGRKGTLVSSLAAWRKYHAAPDAGGDAQTWERQALVKARAVAGDAALGELLERELADTIWGRPAAPRAALAAELGAMRERMEHELAHEHGGRYDVKVGRGGIVDVEFAAQLVELAHGAEHPWLRVRGTVDALERAASAGLVPAGTAATLIDGYRFLRRLENRLRIVHDRAIHEFPSQPEEREKLARRCGFADAAALERAYLAWTEAVRAAYREVLAGA